jgi:hypothetical protein
MAKQRDDGLAVLGLVADILSIPYNLLAGFIVGAMAPVAAIAAIVAGVRLMTGKMPFLGLAGEEEEGERALSLTLMPPDRAEALYAEQRDRIGEEVGRLRTEIQAILKEAQAGAEEAALEQTEEALEG